MSELDIIFNPNEENMADDEQQVVEPVPLTMEQQMAALVQQVTLMAQAINLNAAAPQMPAPQLPAGAAALPPRVEEAKRFKPPAFDTNDVANWARMMHLYFESQNVVGELNRFWAALSTMPHDIQTLARKDHIEGTATAYTDLVVHMNRRFGMTERDKGRKLLAVRVMDDMKPSDILAHLELFRPTSVNTQFFETWMSALPKEVATKVADQEPPQSPMEFMELARRLDMWYADFKATPQTLPPTPAQPAEETFEASVNEVNRRSKPFYKRRGGGNSGRGNNNNNNNGGNKPTAWFCDNHVKFGPDCVSCQPGCKMWRPVPNNNGFKKRAKNE
mgnify:CR=1 FL=1